MHTQRLTRQFERTVNQLRDLQKTRREQERKEMEDVLDIIEMHKFKGQTYNPTEDGFVFSTAQITAAFLSRKRKKLAEEAWLHAA